MKPRKPTNHRKAPPQKSIERVFDDNGLALELFGSYHTNLARIERRLDVALHARGNEVTVSGEGGAVAAAVDVLDGLYARLERGLAVDQAEVDAALRMALAPGSNVQDTALAIKIRDRKFFPRSPAQAVYVQCMDEVELVFGEGRAGTGKTYLAVAKAAERLVRGEVERIILSRPAVEAGEKLGFLPGDLTEKVNPYLRPLYDALHDMIGLDLDSGTMIWSLGLRDIVSLTGTPEVRLAHLIGCDQSTVFLSGQGVIALEAPIGLASGAPARVRWVAKDESMKNAGYLPRAVLMEDRIIWPTHTSRVDIDRHQGFRLAQ